MEDSLKETTKDKKIKLDVKNVEKLELLGSGVSGDVYKAFHNESSRLIALKVIPYKNDEKLKALVMNEVKTLHSLSSDYIIKCYASVICGQFINIYLEYMDLGTLQDLLGKIKKVPEGILGIMTIQVHFIYYLDITGTCTAAQLEDYP